MNTITKVNNLLLIEIDDFLSDTEIDKILNTRKQSFEKAITHYPNYYRNNDRIVENNIVLSSYLFRKLKHLKIPCIVTKITGINDKIRFCRYQKDQLFSKHQDGVYYPNSTYESKFTFLLYLNDNTCFDYGETMFYKSKTDNQPVKTILPRKGKLLIFDHKIWHTGAKVTKGNKYILRSDIFIKSSNQKSHHHQGYIWDLLKLNKKEFLSCGRDKKIKRWNTNLTLLSTMEFHSKSIFKMIHFQNNEFISCSRDFTIKKWNTSGEVLSSIRLKEMILNLVCFQNNLIIAAGTSGNIYLLDTTLTLIKTIQLHHNWIWGLSIMGNKIISCCGW
ncbi:2OG-Fe(II) oxygenase [uncultured Aquimarina sp.]|uniref:2OG-Fe(II) oxygenase n=1 Tax=uncultured Aquimarina sp. TaxID=575652 RepID=UPI00262E1BBD|nr:2OG-Fe(II) oxygenase [uncultured Aquimarina sp.]